MKRMGLSLLDVLGHQDESTQYWLSRSSRSDQQQ